MNKIYLSTKGVSFVNYQFEVKDEQGNMRYTAKTVSERLTGYTLRVWYPNGAVAFTVQSKKKMTLMNLQFEMVLPDGGIVADILQKNKLRKYVYEVPQYNLLLEGDFISHKFDINQGGRRVGLVERKMMSWGDSYEIQFEDPAMEQIILAAALAVELGVIASRRRRGISFG
jgi:uncharacterized protein YxjI